MGPGEPGDPRLRRGRAAGRRGVPLGLPWRVGVARDARGGVPLPRGWASGAARVRASVAAFVLYGRASAAARRRRRAGAVGAPRTSAASCGSFRPAWRPAAATSRAPPPPRPPPPPNADVVVKTSRLPGAGLGLFAVRVRSRGACVRIYGHRARRRRGAWRTSRIS